MEDDREMRVDEAMIPEGPGDRDRDRSELRVHGGPIGMERARIAIDGMRIGGLTDLMNRLRKEG
jgi:hypothetical protein